MSTPNPTPPSAEAMAAAKRNFMAKAKYDEATGCQIWTASRAGNGYGGFVLHGRHTTAHRAAYKLFVGEVPKEMDVCHKCDVRLCVNPEHLFLGTRTENMQDCVRKGRYKKPPPQPTGEAHPKTGRKLTDSEVMEIFAAKGTILSQAESVSRFGVHRDTCHKIWMGVTWRHLTGMENQTKHRTP